MDKSQKQDYIWNTLAGLINAAEAVIMSVFVTRITGLTDAGILTIAFAIGNLFITIGKFGVRNFQVTDANKQYSFSTYLKARILTVFIMILVSIGYLVFASAFLNYEWEKICSILLICLIYALEALEDVFWGYYQSRDHLASGAQLFCGRWVSILLIFPIVLFWFKNLVTALLICFIVSIIIFCIMLKRTYPRICSKTDTKLMKLILQKGDLHAIRNLLITTFPLFGSTFLTFYVNNAPKYAVDACLSDEVLACYGFVAMPVFVIGLLNNFIYQPTLIHMAEEWQNGEIKILIRRILRQLLIILMLTIICLAGAYLLGIPVLSLLYHTDLTNYKSELLILLVASGFLAVSGYFGVVLTTMRFQKYMFISHFFIAIIALLGLGSITKVYGTVGVSIAYTGLMILLCLILGIILFYKLLTYKKG